MLDLYCNIVHSSDSNGADGKPVCTKLLMETVKRNISAVKASYELSDLPLHRFQSVSLSGSRVLNWSESQFTFFSPLVYLVVEFQTGQGHNLLNIKGK